MRATIKLKDALLFGLDRPVVMRGCDCPGCSEAGLYRAPKTRDQLNDYYWFCLIHVRQYNESWDYYAGMSESEIEAHIRFDSTWQRPTSPLGGWRKFEEKMRDDVKRDFFGDEDPAFNNGTPPPGKNKNELPTTIVEALAILELRAPVTLETIKTQYKAMAKKHHPDANGGSKEAEEKIKLINQAFTVLKTLYAATPDNETF
jgi:DnaJ-domain-containing protein 1